MRFLFALLLAAACLWLSSGFASASGDRPLDCGTEELHYSLRWGLIPVGGAKLERGPAPEGCLFAVRAWSNFLTDIVAKVRDEIEAVVHGGSGRSVSYRKSLREGRLSREFSVKYGEQGGTTRYEASAPGGVIVPGGRPHDPLSVLYRFRRMTFPSPGTRAELRVSDGRHSGVSRMVFKGRERRYIAGKYIQTQVFEYGQGGVDGLFRMAPGALLRLWVTDDESRIPVLLKARIVIAGFEGEFTAMLLKAVRGGETVLEF